MQFGRNLESHKLLNQVGETSIDTQEDQEDRLGKIDDDARAWSRALMEARGHATRALGNRVHIQ